MNIRYLVELNAAERCELTALLSAGNHPARKLKRAQILLAADAGIPDEDVAETVGIGTSTVYRTKRRFVEANVEGALCEESRPVRSANSPAGKKPCWWRLRVQSRRLAVPAGELVRLTDHEEISRRNGALAAG
jgi:hypothetical protein